MVMKIKRALSVMLVLIMTLSVFLIPAGAVSEGIESLTFNGLEDERFSVSWWKSDLNGKHYAFLPSDADLSELTLIFSASEDVYVGDEKLTSGERTDAFSEEGEYTLTCGSAVYPLVVMKSENIPAMYIETESGSLDYIHADKSNKEKGTVAVVDGGEITVDAKLSSIKGRGNSTWKWPKKPYNIKFEEKIDLFGMGKAKKWSLLASYNDTSLIRNKVIFDLAEDFGLMYTSKSQHVDLYINGEYMGNYLVCESVEVGSTRVNINDLDDANEDANDGVDIEELTQMGDLEGSVGSMKWVDIPNDPEDITGGYLIEMELFNRYDGEVSGFITDIGQPYVLKSPEYASKAQMEYISGFYQELEDAVFSETGYNSLGKHYSDYIDLESVAKMYIIEEFSMDIDAGRSSAYFYKEAGENTKLVASPVWDFDYALGNGMTRSGVRSDNPDVWFALMSHTRPEESVSGQAVDSLFTALLKHDDFFDMVCDEWNNSFMPLLDEAQQQAQALIELLNASALMDSVRWTRDAEMDTAEEYQAYYDGEAAVVTDFMTRRIAALDKGFSEDSARLYFDVNGGTGLYIEYTIATEGETLRILDNTIEAPEGMIFLSWNTEKDGSGKKYRLGDKITLEKGKTTLYAQYGELNLITGTGNFIAKMRALLVELIQILLTALAAFRQA